MIGLGVSLAASSEGAAMTLETAAKAAMAPTVFIVNFGEAVDIFDNITVHSERKGR